MLSSVADVFVVSLLATKDVLMTAIPWSFVVSLLVVVLVFALLVDSLKIHIFRHFGVR